MSYPASYRYTKDHEWINVTGDTALAGITDHAQNALGDIVFVDLPAAGAKLEAAKTFGSVESVKAVSDLFAPASGEVVEVNEALKDSPEIINQDPHGQGWMVRIRLSNKAELDSLMNAEQYTAYADAEKDH